MLGLCSATVSKHASHDEGRAWERWGLIRGRWDGSFPPPTSERCTMVADRRTDGRAVRNAGLLLLGARSEEHTSELQSQSNLVCRLLLEKQKQYSSRYPERG